MNKRHRMILLGLGIPVCSFLVFAAVGSWALLRFGWGDGTFLGTFVPIFLPLFLFGLSVSCGYELIRRAKEE